MASLHSLRASDRDREEVVERLRAAAAEGRLLVGELEQRLEVAFRARTNGELDVLVADLPVPPAPAPVRVPGRWRPGLPVLAGATLALGILLSVLASAATAGFARAHTLVGGGIHGRPYALYHDAPAGLLALIAPLLVIVFLVTVCAALGWLFSQDSGATHADNA